MKKIICGFAGIGKSTAATNLPCVVDLESAPFEKDWSRYTKVAKHMADNNYTVLLSCHKELRECLFRNEIEYTLVFPKKELKDLYLSNYKKRGDDEKFIELLNNKWEEFFEVLPHEKDVRIIDKYLMDNL